MMSPMNATVRPFFDGGATQQVDDILKWMDALASRECSTDEFLHEVLEREQDDPDLPWEVLALLDQYYRCKKIRHDVFVSLKARLQKESLYLGSGGSVAAPKLVVEEPYLDPDAPTIAAVPPAPPPSDLPLVAVEPVRRANPFEPVQPASTEPALEPAVAVAVASPAAAPEPVMSAAPVPLTEIPAMSADPATPAVEPAPTVTAPPSLRTPAPVAGPRADDLLRGRYRITEILRRDLSGVLVEAVDEVRADVPGVRRRIALQLIESKGARSPELLKRVYQLQSLSHPCIQRVFDVDVDHGEPFVTMESLSGMSLEQFISASGGTHLDGGTVMTIIRAVASALAYAHAHDVAHGDVCAGNIFITEAGEVRLRGFELRGRELRANVADDSLAFAWLAYELLAGLHVRGPGNARRVGNDRLRHPPSITREQWRVLHAALLGKEEATGNVLTTFAGDSLSARILPLNGFVRATPRRRGGGRIAAAFLAGIVVVGAWLFVDSKSGSDAAGDTEAQATVPAQVTQTPVAPAPAPAAPVAAAPAAPAVAPATSSPAPRSLRARVDFPVTSVEVTDDQPFAIIPVRRRDNLWGTVTFRWWTETGSAETNRDFLRIQPRTEMIADGDGGVELRVPLLPDATRLQPRTFYVKIDAPGLGAVLGPRTLTQVTIIPKAHVSQTVLATPY